MIAAILHNSIVYDSTTPAHVELKHAQWQQHMAILGVVDRYGKSNGDLSYQEL